MNRFIENYNKNDFDLNFILSDHWDVIILNRKINETGIHNWYLDVLQNLGHLQFNFESCKSLTKPVEKTHNGEEVYITSAHSKGVHDYNKADHKLISSFTLDWPIYRDIPLPPLWAADPDVFTELMHHMENKKIIKDFDHTKFLHLPQYLFGEYKQIYDDWGHKFFHNIKIQKHHPGMVLPLHTDHMSVRLHIPLTYDNGRFYWGENWAREYKFTPGNVYLINTRILHGTTNFGPQYRANLISNIKDSMVLDLIAL